jgi:alpha-galactosidase
MGFESTDAADFASYGVDYLKYDSTNAKGVPAQTRFNAMRDQLGKTGRPIYFHVNNNGEEDINLWGNKTANSWRSYGLSELSWLSVKRQFQYAA